MYYCGLLPAPLEITFRKYKLLCKARNSPYLNMRLCSSLNEIAIDEILSRYGSGGPMSFNELRKQLFSNFFNSFADSNFLKVMTNNIPMSCNIIYTFLHK